MRLTVKQLREKMVDLPDDAEVFIERIEDVYFEKYGWMTEKVTFGEEYNDIFNASQTINKDGKLIVLGHY